VSGVSPEAESFAELWRERTGEPWDAELRMGVYECRDVREVPAAKGSPRRAVPEDLAALVPMIEAFADEVVPPSMQDRERLETSTRDRLEDDPLKGGFWVWEVEARVVSLSGHGGRTPTGIRVGPVYTPPQDRGEGYATSLVAAQTAWLLANAVSSCFLYTDLANPTSNAIYRRIGYAQHCVALQIRFAGR
jgi:predicted GNAT family acetyltransferase